MVKPAFSLRDYYLTLTLVLYGIGIWGVLPLLTHHITPMYIGFDGILVLLSGFIVYRLIRRPWQYHTELRRQALAGGQPEIIAVPQPERFTTETNISATFSLQLRSGTMFSYMAASFVAIIGLMSIWALCSLLFHWGKVITDDGLTLLQGASAFICLVPSGLAQAQIQSITLTEHSITAARRTRSGTLNWQDIRIFVLIGRRQQPATWLMEVSGKDAVLQWSMKVPRSRWLLVKPSLPLAEYEHLIETLPRLIAAKTRLTLYDLRED
jgi:hypothetical protein